MKTGLLIAADLYGCADDALPQDSLKEALETFSKNNNMSLLSSRIVPEDEAGYGIYCICKEGHIILHVNHEKGFVSIDGFSYSEGADPEKLVREICGFLSPDKMKLTYVDRGDFGKKADMKPRHRNKSRKITQMRNMTKRFGKFLMKPKSL
ncbi:MAG: S-adenosylmethionine decarboxylase [Acidaminococcaceae bacterium]|nr:S-adenosylmethionine decarboxylase [Acidaminococcaceae bacterium]MBQ8492276.1 S-adenosylmethionine decarboxylase [Acidaminococcaceae bacterium]